MYMFPAMPPGGDQAEHLRKMASGPTGLLVYFPSRDFNFAKALTVEFFTELVQVFLAVYLLALSRARSFGARLGFFAVAGGIAAFGTNVSYANWFGYPATYTVSAIVTTFIGFLAAGAVAAALKVGCEEPKGAAAPA
jgi:hypothetical protein